MRIKADSAIALRGVRGTFLVLASKALEMIRTLPPTARGLLAMLATGLLWGMVIVAPVLVPDVPATALVGARYAVFGAISFAVGRRHIRGADWRRAFRYAVTGFIGYYLLVVVGVQQAGPAPVALVMGTTPVVYAIASARRARLQLRTLAAPLSVMGMGLIIAYAVDLRSSALGGSVVLGLLMAAGGVAVWTWYGLDNGNWVRRPEVDSKAWSSIVGMATGVLALPLLGHGIVVGIGDGATMLVGLSVLLGFGSAWLGTVAWNAANRLLPETVVGPSLVIELIVTLTYAHLWARSWPAWSSIVGYGLLVAGVVATVLVIRRSTPAVAAA